MTPSAGRGADVAAPPHDERQRIHLGWLVRLRWGAAAGQALTILVAKAFYEAPWPLAPLLALIVVELGINVACAVWLARGRSIGGAGLAAVLGADVLILTALLASSGGASNPFSFVYLVYLALAAVILESHYTWALVALSLAAYGTLFSGTFSGDDDAGAHAHHMQSHLRGMWIAFGVAACFIVYFVTRVRRSAERLSAALETERAAAARNERLVSLATLAAGAAHELATPLGTVAIVVRELELQLTGDAAADARLAREQLDRCRAILDDMAAGTGQHIGEAPSEITVGQLVNQAVGAIDASALEIALAPHDTQALRLPVRAMTRAIAGLVRNAVQASPEGGKRVRITARADGGELCLEVADTGPGMAPDVLARAGEPFFTTKAPGRGMGLGLFLARSLMEQLGGSLRLESALGQGTRAEVRLPIEAATACRSAKRPAAAQDGAH